MHYWADLQSVHGFHGCDNILPNAKCQRVLLLALCLVNFLLEILIGVGAFLWPPYGIAQAIIFLPCGFFFYLSSSSSSSSFFLA